MTTPIHVYADSEPLLFLTPEILLAAFLALACFFVAGCGTPVSVNGAYENPNGARYEAGATFTLPAKKGLAK